MHLMHLSPFQSVLITLALVSRSISTSNPSGSAALDPALDQCDSTPPLLDQSDDDPSLLSSTFAIWSERLFGLLDPRDAEPHTGRLRAFASDLHLAFVARRHGTRPSHKRKKPHLDVNLHRRADSQRVNKCKVQSSGLGSHHGDDGSKSTSTTLPGMTPTDSNGRPLPTQTVSEGHGGSGHETIAITQPCGSIPVGASSKESHVTCNTTVNRPSQPMYKRRQAPTVK